MIQLNEIILMVSKTKFELPKERNKYAESISYESLYEENNKPNKNIMEYNTLKTEEMIREKNKEIIKEIFLKQNVDPETLLD